MKVSDPHTHAEGEARRNRAELLAIGFWYDPLDRFLGRHRGVDPTRLVQPEWAGDERSQLAQYLRAGHRCCSYLGFSFCRFECGIARNRMGSGDLTDGTWIWPEGLAHYVEEHGICLPDEFLADARTSGFVIHPRGGDNERSRDDDVSLGVGSDALWMNWAERRGAIVEGPALRGPSALPSYRLRIRSNAE
jgi:hypothetical protein